MLPISVCMIAKNEEKNIENCLMSLQSYPFEIIVVDTGSTDHTKEIALKYTDKIYDFPWVNDFSAARNYSISKASNDWVLVIDCDESLKTFDPVKLSSLLLENEKSIGLVLQKNFIHDVSTKNQTNDTYAARLFHKKYYHFENKIHEQVKPLLTTMEPQYFQTKLILPHTGYSGTQENITAKAERNISMLLENLKNCPESSKPYFLFQLGQSYGSIFTAISKGKDMEALEKARSYYKKAMDYPIGPQTSYYKELIVQYGHTFLYKNSIQEGISFLEKYSCALSGYADFSYLLGLLYRKSGDFETALLHYTHALTLTDYTVLGTNSYFCHYDIGLIYETWGDWDKAISAYTSCPQIEASKDRLEKLKYKKEHPIPISICIIGRDEEANIGECLKRLVPLNCEIIYVDTGSHDKTVSIASRYTGNIYYFEWKDDFSAARNFSITKAANDWILIVDCDEYLEEPEKISDLLPGFVESLKDNEENIGIITKKNNFLLNNESTMIKAVEARFFRKSFAQYRGTVHEQICPFQGGYASRFPTPFSFLHMGYYGTDTLARKADRNLTLLLKELENHGPSPYIYYQIGQSYYSLADYEQALKYFDLGLSMDVNPEFDYVKQMVESYGYCLLNLNMVQDALGLEGIYDTFGTHADFVFLMGLVYMKNGLFNEAVGEFLKATSFEDSSVYGVTSYMAYYNIGVIYECTGNIHNALEYYKKCGNYMPAANRIHELLKQ